MPHLISVAEGAGRATFVAAVSFQATGQAEVSLFRCTPGDCGADSAVSLGTYAAKAPDPRQVPEPLVLTVDRGGRPITTLSAGPAQYVITCDSPQCTNHSAIKVQAHVIDAKRVSHPGGIVSLLPGALDFCGTDRCEVKDLGRWQGDVAGEGALALTAAGLHVVVTVPGVPPGIRIGEPASEQRQLVLWHCPDIGCASTKRTPLYATEAPLGELWLAVRPDGRVLIAERRRDSGWRITVMS